MDEGMASWRPPVGRQSSTAKLDVGVDEGMVVAGRMSREARTTCGNQRSARGGGDLAHGGGHLSVG
jgi:hypothetical protein